MRAPDVAYVFVLVGEAGTLPSFFVAKGAQILPHGPIGGPQPGSSGGVLCSDGDCARS